MGEEQLCICHIMYGCAKVVYGGVNACGDMCWFFLVVGRGYREKGGSDGIDGVFSLVAHVSTASQLKGLCEICVCALRC